MITLAKPVRRALTYLSLTALSVLAIGIVPASTSADKPPCIPAFHDGNTVFFTVVSDNVVGVGDRGDLRNVAIPLYAFGPPGSQPQPDVLPLIPGQRGYRPWWKVIFVAVLDGRDVSTNPFTSEAEILAAQAAGDVELVETGEVFLCQVLPSCRNRAGQ
jgi:hypothetical protein